jgi:microcystin-dependent protein
MSYKRAKSRAVNQNVYFENRLTTFTNPPVYTGDLIVERDETVRGNLTIGHDLRATNFYSTGNYYLDNYILIPPGTIIQSAAINVPNGWKNCNGDSLSTIDYAGLFTAIGYTYGGSSGFFLVPDMRGRIGVGAGQGTGLTNRTLGVVSGAENHTLTASQMPSHVHTGTTDISGSHTHSSNANGGTGSSGNPVTGLAYSNGSNTASTGLDSTNGEINLFEFPRALTINSAGDHAHTFTTGSAGSDASHNNMQPFIVLYYLIKY